MTEATERDMRWAQTCADSMSCEMFVIVCADGAIDVVDERDVHDDTRVIFQASPTEE